jgi:prevent-host-death family protein
MTITTSVRIMDVVKVQARFEELIEEVAAGAQIIITQAGRPVARLTPATPDVRCHQTRAGDEDIAAEIDLSGGRRDPLHGPDLTPTLPVCLDSDVQHRLLALADAKGVDPSAFVNALLRQDLERLEVASLTR